MCKYFCHKCSITNGIIPGKLDDFNPTGSTYQLEKFVKHTLPPTASGTISVFNQDENKKFKDYLVNTLVSGSLEIDKKGRTNIVWIAGENTGFKYQDGEFQCNTDAVKVVLHNDELKIHGYPTGSAELTTKICEICGDKIGY